MRIWIFQSGEPLHTDADNLRPMRAMNLANVLLDRGHEVVLWSSSFFHQEKRHRSEGYEVLKPRDRLQIRLIPSPGYKKNIGMGRIYDHVKLAQNLFTALKKGDFICPDVAFVGYPPIETADALAQWLVKQDVPFIIDVKDQWPSIFVDKLPSFFRPLSKLAFFPYFYLGRRTLRKANALCSISHPFLEWSQNFAMRSVRSEDIVIPLTTKRQKFVDNDFNESKRFFKSKGIDLQDGQPRFCFVGSLSPAFDFSTVFDVAGRFKKGHLPGQFVLCGDGSEINALRKMASGLDNVIFTGWVSAAEMNALFSVTTASLAPYRNSEDFKQSIPNKIIDALANGLPILTSLQGEVKSLIQTAEAGLYYENSDDLYRHCVLLMQNEDLIHQMQRQADRCYEDKFDYYTIYNKLASLIEKLGRQSERQEN